MPHRHGKIGFLYVFLPPLFALASVCFTAPGARADGEQRALLIGVSSYDNAAAFAPLKGPANDVALLAGRLRERGFQPDNIVMLANRADAQGRPTRAAILREFDRLAETTERGDIVFIHFSGHGSQQPNNNPDEDPELDGFDEILLPEDSGLWTGELGSIANAIIDDEIAVRLAVLRDRGAFVVFVSDSCYSEGARRAIQTTEQGRGIQPEQLGIPQAALEAAARAPRLRGGAREDDALDTASLAAGNLGGLVAFYAAQSIEEAPELLLPPEAPDNQYGLLTFHLATILASNPRITYRQAFEHILYNYRAMNRFAPTPMIEGTDANLDQIIFGSDKGVAVRQWPVIVDGGARRIPAGRLHQLSADTILAVVPAATTVEASNVLGYARLSDVEMLRSTLEPIDYAGRPAPAQIPAGAFARVVDARFETRLAVALPNRPAVLSADERVVWRELDRLRSAGLQETRIAWSAPDASSADLRLLVDSGKLWFVPPSGVLEPEGPTQTPHLTIPDPVRDDGAALARFQTDLVTNLRKVAKVRTLFALARELAGNELRRGLGIRLEVRRFGSGATEALRLNDVPELHDGDTVTFRVTNWGRRPVDLTVLYIDSRFGIEAWFPYAGESNRLRRGDTASGELVVNLETVGLESLLFIAAAVEPQAPRTDLSFLVQEGLTTRAGPAAGRATLTDLLLEAGWPAGALRDAGRAPVILAAASSFTWNVRPSGTE
jgi:hypothetical protein